tara:strand:- start:521 stop:931 length:411 start_codon:yes stop_codon:yes gene_type:complete
MNKKRITNIDTLSAFFDRLITERIKWYFFKKDDNFERIEHQEIIISEIRDKISCLMEECFKERGYNYIGEKRTFNENEITDELEDLIVNDINIGESDRERLNLAMMNEKRLRKANEGRARNKNNIDKIFKNMVDKK